MTDYHTESADILIVEDNGINLFFVTHILEIYGYPYRTAANGEEAIAAFVEQRPLLVLMDIQMPVMDGLTASQEIRRLEHASGVHTPIIALTARAQESDQRLCMQAGMDDYLSKPIRKEILAEKLAQWLPTKAA